MKRFLIKSVILFFPLLIWASVVILIDPFNYFNLSNFVSRTSKIENADRLNTLLFRTVDFIQQPCENILVGDSRTDLIPTSVIELESGKKFKKLTTNAAKLNEIFDLIYFANDKIKLKTVVVGINFSMFNEYGYADRVHDVKKIIDFPPRYIYSKATAEAAYYVARSEFFGVNINDVPPMTKKEFWDWNIKEKATHWYGKYKFPGKLYDQLIQLDSFAKQKNIELVFIIVPHYKDFQKRVKDFGLQNEQARFKEIMMRLNAKVVDYDFENTITSDSNNFTDPVHYREDIGKLMIKEIYSGNYALGKLMN
jgi:hypothetical protein